MDPALGGSTERYTPEVDPQSGLAQAYLSLPYGNGSPHFRQPGYFQNVARFAREFDFILRHLPREGLLLDLGADGTWSTARLAERGLTCVALDITDHLTLAHLFRQRYPDYALVNVDMHERVFRDGAFDVVTAFNALHHSKRLDALAQNIARMLAPGGTLGFVEPYVQNAQQESAFGASQVDVGINENVHTIERWHEAFTRAGLELQLFSLSDSFNAIYRKVSETARQDSRPILATYYDAALAASPTKAHVRVDETVAWEVTVESRGRAAWASRGPTPVRLSYHLQRVTAAGSEMVVFDNERTLLEDFVCCCHPFTISVPVTIDAPGVCDIEFDLVHETRTWFAERGARTAAVRVVVD